MGLAASSSTHMSAVRSVARYVREHLDRAVFACAHGQPATDGADWGHQSWAVQLPT